MTDAAIDWIAKDNAEADGVIAAARSLYPSESAARAAVEELRRIARERGNVRALWICRLASERMREPPGVAQQ
jgi:hypothetical protein